VQSLFTQASHHNVSSLDQADGSRVECIHCHNPHAASAAAPLRHPDTGAVWTGEGEAFCLVCHDGSPPAGVSFPPAAPGTGYDKSSFVGTIHDGQLGPNSCGHCHDAHGSPHLATLKDRYVVADYTEYDRGNGDYAACWMCHDEDATVASGNSFQNRHAKHVRDEDAPCIVCHDVHAGFDAGEPGLVDWTYPVEAGYDIAFIDERDGSTSFWIDADQSRGHCYISCHGDDHHPLHYNRWAASTTDCSACHG
jgi:hypothetical protein